jgi:hypothetical protein
VIATSFGGATTVVLGPAGAGALAVRAFAWA